VKLTAEPLPFEAALYAEAEYMLDHNLEKYSCQRNE
jgi:hypothetical protein